MASDGPGARVSRRRLRMLTVVAGLTFGVVAAALVRAGLMEAGGAFFDGL